MNAVFEIIRTVKNDNIDLVPERVTNVLRIDKNFFSAIPIYWFCDFTTYLWKMKLPR